jgi:hypothetical protein
MRRRALITTALLLGLALGACATSGERAPADSGEDRRADAQVQAVVENRSSQNLRVLALIDGAEWRLGTVSSDQIRTFKLPSSLTWGKEFQLIARPFDPGRTQVAGLRSQPVSLRSGLEVNWLLDDRPGVLNAPVGVLTVFAIRTEGDEDAR